MSLSMKELYQQYRSLEYLRFLYFVEKNFRKKGIEIIQNAHEKLISKQHSTYLVLWDSSIHDIALFELHSLDKMKRESVCVGQECEIDKT